MINCPICYQDFNDFKLVSPGCCSIKVCKNCIKQCDKCPQCKEELFWKENKEDNDETWKYKLQILNLVFNLELAQQDILDLSKVIMTKQKVIIDNQKKIEELKTIIINNQSQRINNSELESVIQRYHLNII